MEGAAQSFLSNARQLLSKEYQQLRGVGAEVAELRDDLDALNALLVMQSEAEDGAVDRFVQVCMKQLRELAYDAEDCPGPTTASVPGWDASSAPCRLAAVSPVKSESFAQFLYKFRYLILIDDVWTIRAWDAIQSKLPRNNKGSRIIVTMHIESVAKACSRDSVASHCIHKMEPLKIEDSKKLFCGRVFGPVDASCPEEFKHVMEDILKKCGGMPLAIVSIASVLAGYKTNKAKWETIFKSIGSQMESHPTLEGMKHIVTLSYNHLPHELKACMYLCNFPEDYAIREDRLLSRWIAEGLVHQKRGLTMWEVAESYLDEFLSRNMIEEAGHVDGNEWMEQTYRVHDLLLEVMVSKSLEANFVSLHGGQYGRMLYDKIRRLSIHGNVDDADSPTKRKPTDQRRKDDLDVQHVRSLNMFHLHKHNLLDQLGSFTLLRVLDLEDCKGVTNKHVRYVCNLYLLRFLSLRGTNVSKVPRQVENLEHLHTLYLSYTLLVGLPKTITKLEKLERLYVSNKDNYWGTLWTMPQGLKKMKALRRLGKVDLGNDRQVAREVGELEQLEYLALSLDDRKPIDKDVVEELALSLSKMHYLRVLIIAHTSHDSKILNFLHHLPTPPPLLHTLWIRGDIDGLPSWIGSLTHLVTFSIVRTTLTDDQLFGVLCKLPNLKTLYVTWNSYSDRDELVARTSHKFPVLRDLAFGGYLPKALRFEEGSMTTLETIELDFDPRSADVEERSIIGIEQLTNLKKVILDNCRAGNPALSHAILEQLKEENDRCSRSNKQFQIVVKNA